MSWERTWAYAGGPFALHGWPASTIHTDPQFAAQVGLPDPIITGTQTQGYIVQLLIDLFGPRWLNHGHLSGLKFIKPIGVGETVQAHARVSTKEQDGPKLCYTLAIWCAKQNGEQALIGHARGWIEPEE